VSRRAFVVVLDACGVGALPDAADYGDADADTLGHLARAVGGLELPVLGGLGLGRVATLAGVPPAGDPVLHGRLHPLGPGKESTTGHWELMGVGPAAREVMQGEHAVGRVIARPFQGTPGAFTRTHGRRDFSLPPPSRSYLDELRADGVPVHAVGKVDQLFAGVGVDRSHPGPTNPIAIESTDRLLDELEAGLVFVNLVETDQVYGHRKDVAGFERALRQIDAAAGSWLEHLREEDLLVLTADHGCDPTTPGTDHTREHAPLLAVFPGHGGRRHDGPLADVGASALRWLAGRDAAGLPGSSFL
jgi:phosphopentomutase